MCRYLIAAALLVLPITARSVTILPGVDLLQTRSTAAWSFANDPIPADFFGPGSDPFTGVINFVGEPLLTSPWVGPSQLGYVDTIIQRQDAIEVPVVPSSDLIPIELVQLSLVSVNPITVTFNNGLNPELWDVELDNSPTPSGPGEMNVERIQTNGGTSNMVLPITPLFTFTRQSDSAIRQLDGASSGHSDVWQATGVPWQAPAAGVLCSDFALSYSSNAQQPAQFNGSESSLPITNACLPAAAVPALSWWATVIMALALMLTAMGGLLRRRLPIP